MVLSACLVLMATGCSQFLEESSNDEVRPSTANELEQLLLGEGYSSDDYFMPYLEVLTDDVESNYDAKTVNLLQAGASVFTWKEDMNEIMVTGPKKVAKTDTWEKCYAHIMGCNVVLDMLDRVDGSEAEKENLRGQALALRAFYHFILVNLYGLPYNAEGIDPSNALGIPLSTESPVKDDFPPRNTVAEVYRQIETDLLTAAPLMEKYGKSNPYYRVTDLFVHTLLSRVYLYMEKWDESIQHADYVIEHKPTLVPLATYVTGISGGTVTFNKKNGHVYSLSSVEMIWGYSNDMDRQQFFPNASGNPAFVVSAELMNVYEYNGSNTTNVGDLRRSVYFLNYQDGNFVWRPYYGTKSAETAWYPRKGMRVAELYLNRAESYIHKYRVENKEEFRKAALADLNVLREHRFDTRNEAYVPVDIMDGETLLTFCREERRRELCFEDHRWFDLRRYGRPEIRHVMEMIQGQPVEYTLEAGSPRYALPIADIVRERNPALEQNKY